MVLSWTDPRAISGDEKRYPYTHWWLEHEAAQGDAAAQRAALTAFTNQEKLRSRGTGGRAADIVANFPFAQAMPALLDAASLRPAEPADRAPVRPVAPLRTTLQPGDTIMAAIDDGALFAHERLHMDDRLQLDWVWLQGAPWHGESPLVCGRELHRGEIDRLRQMHRRGGGVDEDALYREVGLIDMRARQPQSAAQRTSHGMAVMDLLSGPGPGLRPAWPGEGGAQEGPGRVHLMWVGLPPRVTHDTSGTFIPFFVLLALHELLKRVRELAERHPDVHVPVTINMSYGLTAGPKDGRGLLGRYVEERLAGWDLEHAPLSFFVPAGNTRLTQSRARVAPGAPEPLFWHLPPDDPTPSFVEIWGPEHPVRPEQPDLRVVVTAPGTDVPLSSPMPEAFDTFADLLTGEGDVAMRAYARWVPTTLDPLNPDPAAAPGPGRECLLLAARPTRPRQAGGAFIRPGRWRIAPLGDGGTPLDIYVQRDDTLPGYARRGRQSWLEDPLYVRRDQAGRTILTDPEAPGPVRREGTFNAIAAGPGTRFVAGLRANAPATASHAPFSALGREHHAALAEGPAAWPWIIVAGARSGSRVPVRGTSFAAPQAARSATLEAARVARARPSNA